MLDLQRSMMLLAASEVIKGILAWLHGDDETQWYDETKLLAGTVSKLREMARPIQRRDKTGSRSAEPPVISPEAARISTALPHLYKMTDAMQRRNRTAAIENGRVALAVLSKNP